MRSRPGAGIFATLTIPAVLWPAFDPATSHDGANSCSVYVHKTVNPKLVKTGQNWYYSLHA
jgi:hypothetical protein